MRPVIRIEKESEGHKDLRFLFRTHSFLEPVGSRSPLRFGRRKTEVPRISLGCRVLLLAWCLRQLWGMCDVSVGDYRML